MRINEIFTTMQGEGYWAGRPATFIRLQGCPVGCPWCDTKYTWQDGSENTSIEDIMKQVPARPTHVVITGGEPTLQPLDELILALRAAGHYIQLETSGFQDLLGKEVPDWVTWSPKPNLMYIGAADISERCNEIKWVIDDVVGFDAINSTVRAREKFGLVNVTLMPEGTPPSQGHQKTAYDWVMKLQAIVESPVCYSGRLQWQLKIK